MKTAPFLALTAVGLMGLAALTPWLAGRMPRKPRTFCSVALSNPTAALLDEVERGYGQPIRGEPAGGLAKGFVAVSGLDPYGVPFVRIEDPSVSGEAGVYHELSHLKLNLESYPTRVVWDTSMLPLDNGRRYEPLTTRLRLALLNPLLHRVFYPRMKTLGFATDDAQRKFVKEWMSKPPSASSPVYRVLDYVTFSLEVEQDASLLEQLDAHYRKQKWDAELDRGRTIVGVIRQGDVSSSDKLLDVFVKAAGMLLDGQVSIELRGTIQFEAKGRKFTTAAFSFRPVATCPLECLDALVALGPNYASSASAW